MGCYLLEGIMKANTDVSNPMQNSYQWFTDRGVDILNGFPSKSVLDPPFSNVLVSDLNNELGGMCSLVQQKTAVQES